MSRALALSIVALIAAHWVSIASAEVTVSFSHPERYTDISRDPAESETQLREIADHLKALGRKYLKIGVNLRIEILDVDLAGEYEIVGRQGRWTRVMRRDTRPRIVLRYVLDAGARILDSAEETVTDASYLSRARRHPTETLRHEKQMLEGWFSTRIAGSGRAATPE